MMLLYNVRIFHGAIIAVAIVRKGWGRSKKRLKLERFLWGKTTPWSYLCPRLISDTVIIVRHTRYLVTRMGCVYCRYLLRTIYIVALPQ